MSNYRSTADIWMGGIADMLGITEKVLLNLIIAISLCGTVSAIEKEVRSETVITTRIGTADGEFGYKTYEDGSWIEPTAIAIDSSGNIFISDPLNSRIQKFDKKGKYISKINIKINNLASVTEIIDLTIDKLGNLYALNKFDNIFIFDSSGKLINTISLEGKELAWHENSGWINAPVQCQMIALDVMSNIYLHTFDGMLIKLDQKGNVLKKWSRNFITDPSAFFLDQNGNLYYSQKQNVWDVYDKTGNYLREINNANNPYPATCPPRDNDCQFPPKFVDAKGNYYFYNLDTKTKDLRAIYKFSKEHKLINKYKITTLDFREEPNMVKFDNDGNLYGPSQKSPSKKSKFPMIMKFIME